MQMTPARRVTLAVCVPLALALIGWTGFNVVALVGTGQYSFATPLTLRDGTLNANVSGGDVTLVPGSTAQLSGKITYSLIRPSVTVGDNGVTFRCSVPTGTCSMDGTMTVPRSANVNLSSGDGDLTVNGGIDGNVSLSSGAGDLTADGLAGIVSLKTGVGDIAASSLTASDVTVSSGAGDVTLRFTRVPSSVRVTSSVGDITIVVPAGSYHIEGGSSVGDFSYPQGMNDTASPHVISADSSVGDVTISEG